MEATSVVPEGRISPQDAVRATTMVTGIPSPIDSFHCSRVGTLGG